MHSLPHADLDVKGRPHSASRHFDTYKSRAQQWYKQDRTWMFEMRQWLLVIQGTKGVIFCSLLGYQAAWSPHRNHTQPLHREGESVHCAPREKAAVVRGSGRVFFPQWLQKASVSTVGSLEEAANLQEELSLVILLFPSSFFCFLLIPQWLEAF